MRAFRIEFVLLLFSLRKSEENQDLNSLMQSVREEGGRVAFVLLEDCWVSSA